MEYKKIIIIMLIALGFVSMSKLFIGSEKIKIEPYVISNQSFKPKTIAKKVIPLNKIDENGWINVNDIGIYGDGATDVSEKVQDIITKNQGKKIYFPKGIYVISKLVRIPSNTYLYGDGNETLFLAEAGKKSGTGIFEISSLGHDIVIEKISISGNSAINNGSKFSDKDGIHLLDVWKAERIVINECYFLDNVYCAIRIFGGKNLTISNCKFSGVDCGVITLGDYAVDDLEISYCEVDGHSKSEGISLYGRLSHNNVRIYNNVIMNKIYGNGIFVSKVASNSNIQIYDNVIKNCASAIIINNSSSCIVKNNFLITTTMGKGITLSDSNSVQLVDNYIQGTKNDAIAVKNSIDTIIDNNTIMITSNADVLNMAGIKIYEGTPGILITNNYIDKIEKSECKFGIYDKSLNDIVLKDNVIKDNLKIYKAK